MKHTMKIKIKATDTARITEAVKVAEGKSTARLFDAHEVDAMIKYAEKKLHELQIPKKFWAGCTIESIPEALPNSYKSVGEGTFCQITFCSSGWFVTDISRIKCHHQPHGLGRKTELCLSQLAHNGIPMIF